MSKYTVKYKVLSYDPSINSIVIRWAKEGEEYKDQAYNFELHNQGARDFEHLKTRIAATAMNDLKSQEAKHREIKDPGTRQQYESMVGQEFIFTEEEIWAGEHPNQKQDDLRTDALMAIEDQYPIADRKSVEKILSTTFPNVYVEPVYRMSDKNLIGVRSQRMGTLTPEMATTSFRSLIRLTEVCRKYGVPNLGEYIVNKKTEKIEKWQEFWKEQGYEQCGDVYQTQQIDSITSESFKIVEYDCSYVYMPWTPEMAAARKKHLINEARNEIDFVEYNGYNYEADEQSAKNLQAALTSMIHYDGSRIGNVSWRTRDNEIIDLNADDIYYILKKIAEKRDEQYKESWKRKSEINLILNSSMPDAEKIKKIDDV